jgi:hypothetical protein
MGELLALNKLGNKFDMKIASLSGAADDPHYFQISVPVQPARLEFKL